MAKVFSDRVYVPPGEWEVVRFHGLKDLGKLLALMTPVGPPAPSRFMERWATWMELERSRFGDHIVGTRVKV